MINTITTIALNLRNINVIVMGLMSEINKMSILKIYDMIITTVASYLLNLLIHP